MLKISQLTKLCIKKATKLHVYSIEGVDNDDLESFNTAIELISTKQPLIDYLWDIETIEEQNSNKKTLELCNSAKALAKHDTEMKLIQSQVSQLQNYKTMVDRFNANSDNKKLETDIHIESKHQSKSLLKQSTMLSEEWKDPIYIRDNVSSKQFRKPEVIHIPHIKTFNHLTNSVQIILMKTLNGTTYAILLIIIIQTIIIIIISKNIYQNRLIQYHHKI